METEICKPGITQKGVTFFMRNLKMTRLCNTAAPSKHFESQPTSLPWTKKIKDARQQSECINFLFKKLTGSIFAFKDSMVISLK